MAQSTVISRHQACSVFIRKVFSAKKASSISTSKVKKILCSHKLRALKPRKKTYKNRKIKKLLRVVLREHQKN